MRWSFEISKAEAIEKVTNSFVSKIIEFERKITKLEEIIQKRNEEFINNTRENEIEFRKEMNFIIDSKIKNNTFWNINKDKIYGIWFSKKGMISEKRKDGIKQLNETGLQPIIITSENLPIYTTMTNVALHKGFGYLSSIHQSDYLRSYFMNFFGGGYSDIKKGHKNWTSCISKILANPNLDCCGMPELKGGIAYPGGHGRMFFRDYYPLEGGNYSEYQKLNDGQLDAKLATLLNKNVSVLISNQAFYCKPGTPFTKKWYELVQKTMDNVFIPLKNNPADHDRMPPPKSKYPIPWAKLQGELFATINYIYRDRILPGLPWHSLNDYLKK